MSIITLLKRAKIILSDLLNIIIINMYNEYTVENYYRKKGYSIGKNNRIFTRHFGSEPYLIKIGNQCTITGGVKFITHDGGAWIFKEKCSDLTVFGKIEIKDNCFIGFNTLILPNVTIGPNSVVGAGSVVTKDVPPNTVVAGVPAKVINSSENYKKKCLKITSDLNLKGPAKTWKSQLIKHFWE